jgi:hypothetical protein
METMEVNARKPARAWKAWAAAAAMLCAVPAAASEPLQLAAVLHVHSTFSSGRYTPAELVAMARERKIDVLVLTDHDRLEMQYGLPPFRNLFKWTEERNSVASRGVEAYLGEIARLNAGRPQVLVIPGVQSSPFYYWSGSPLDGTLTAHDYHKELLLLGMRRAEDYRGLPLLHSGWSTRHLASKLPQTAALAALGGIGLCLFFFRGGRWKWVWLLVGAAGVLGAADRHPFAASRYDAYHGDQGIGPYQEVIDHARRCGGLVFWAHPESNHAVNGVDLGPIRLVTDRHAEDLAEASGYTGFAALYADTATITEPGALWDRMLERFCRGVRPEPVWGMAEVDFHEEGDGVELDSFQTIVIAAAKTEAAVLDALSRGRFYAVQKGGGHRLVLERFEAGGAESGRKADSGQEVSVRGAPKVSVRVSASDGSARRVTLSLVRGGVAMPPVEGVTPAAFEYMDEASWEGRSFYRLEVNGEDGSRLLSNPVFVERRP